MSTPAKTFAVTERRQMVRRNGPNFARHGPTGNITRIRIPMPTSRHVSIAVATWSPVITFTVTHRGGSHGAG